MRVSFHKQKQSPRRRRQQGSRYQALVEAIADIGLERIFDIELHARAGFGAGKFSYIDVAIRFLGAKGTEKDTELQTADEVAEMLLEGALEYEDENGPHTFQAVIFCRTDDDGRERDPEAKRTFRTSDDPNSTSDRDDVGIEAMQSISRTMTAFQKTTSAVLKDLRDTAAAAREFQPSGEAVAAQANAQVRLLELKLEHAYDDKIVDVLDNRMEQLIDEIAPGLREAIATEPTKNTLPERLRGFYAELSPEQHEQLEDVLGEDMWPVLLAAKETQTNVDCRSVLETFQEHWTELPPPAKLHLNNELQRILGDALFIRLAKTLRKAGVL